MLSGRLALLVVAVLVVGIAAVGCGGGGDEGSGSGSTEIGKSTSEAAAPKVAASSLTEGQFVKRASAICGRLHTSSFGELTAFAARYEREGRPENALLIELVRKVLVPRIERETSELAKLGGPEGQAAAMQAFVNAQTQGAKQAVAMEDPKSLEDVAENFNDAGAKARALGIASCDNGAAPAPQAGG